jgi:hypothetical protein
MHRRSEPWLHIRYAFACSSLQYVQLHEDNWLASHTRGFYRYTDPSNASRFNSARCRRDKIIWHFSMGATMTEKQYDNLLKKVVQALHTKVVWTMVVFVAVLLTLPILLRHSGGLPPPQAMERSGLGLAKFIADVKEELYNAEARARERNEILFPIKNVQLEINVVVQQKGNAKAEFLVTTASAEFGSERTQKIILQMAAPEDTVESIPADK